MDKRYYVPVALLSILLGGILYNRYWYIPRLWILGHDNKIVRFLFLKKEYQVSWDTARIIPELPKGRWSIQVLKEKRINGSLWLCIMKNGEEVRRVEVKWLTD